jgi:hypothetical protein
MTDKILLVTPPDDTLLQGIRVLLVELDNNQSSMVSAALLNTNLPHNIINYVWQMGNRIDWLLDKMSKSDLIVFNAEAQNNGAIELILGYVAAQPQSYYFGNLKDLHLANDRAIYSVDELTTLLEKIGKQHDQTR